MNEEDKLFWKGFLIAIIGCIAIGLLFSNMLTYLANL